MRPRQIRCLTAESAARLLREVAGGQVERRFIPATLRAVARWIETDQRDQADLRAGMGRIMVEAARVVGGR